MNSLRKTRCLLSDWLDRLINIFKWPFATIAVFFFPSSVLSCWPSILQLVRSTSLLPFLLGIAAFWLVNKVMRKTSFWAWLGVLEHETVHLLAGLACLKIPNRWRVTSRGGHVGFDRGSNWIITISPYVLPLIPLLTFVSVQSLASFTPLKSWVLPASMGFSMAMHIAFTWMESHYRQPDIQRVGGLFSILVAPTLHVIFVAVVLILSSSSITSAVGPISNLFQQIGQNGLVAWKAFANHGSEFIFAEAPTEDSDAAPSAETHADPRPAKRASSVPSGIRFERKSAVKPDSNAFRGGRKKTAFQN
jgi:hypothetical protein